VPREIRASDRRSYQKVTDIYALSVDYDAHAPRTRDFFATVQDAADRPLRQAVEGSFFHEPVNMAD